MPMRLARLWSRLELPRAYQLLRRAGVWDDSLWREEPERVCRGRWHGCRMRLDLREFHQRGAYFYGRTLDVPVLLCVREALRQGDTCIDVGANIGITAMVAARAVGEHGRVLVFEPNPAVYERLLWHLGENRLSQVEPQPVALSDAEQVVRLRVPAMNCGAATLGRPPARYGRIEAVYDVPARVGDEILPGLPQAPMLIKMDVEGHEARALRGLRRTIEGHHPAMLLECNAEMLPRNGTSVEELFSLMGSFDYEPYVVGAAWGRLSRRWRLRLQPVTAAWRPTGLKDVLFLAPGCVHRDRLQRFIDDRGMGPVLRHADEGVEHGAHSADARP